MTDPEDRAPAGEGLVRRRRTSQPESRRRHRRRRRRRGFLLGAGLLLLGAVGVAGWVGVTGYQARGELVTARDAAATARAAVLAGDAATARAAAEQAAGSAADARAHTSGPAWWTAAHLPLVGPTVQAARGVAAGVDDLAEDVLLPLTGVAGVLDPASLRPAAGRLDLAALRAAQEPLRTTSAAATALAERVSALPATGRVAAVEDARVALREQTGSLAGLLAGTSTAAELLPPMLGADGPRSYFVAFQTNAEARGTGGLVGAFGLLRADQGQVSLDRQAANTALRDVPAGVVDLGPDYAALHGSVGATGIWVNSNLSPHFPYAAQVWRGLWQAQSGEVVDGAVATDPVALSYLLAATGPVTLPSGEVVTAEGVVALTESEVYARFSDDAERKDFLQTISTAVVQAVLVDGGGSTTEVLSALGRAVGEGRIAVWSARPAEEDLLAATPLGGAVPDDPAPYAGVTVNSSGNGKLDYYLERDLRYTAGSCAAGTRPSTVTATLTNRAPASGLPPYVTIQGAEQPGPPGTNHSRVALATTRGAQLTRVTVDGVPSTAGIGSERGRSVYTVDVGLAPGATAVVSWSLLEPSAPGAARVPVQPLVRSATTAVDVPDCGS